ncbi:hypothetical protein [Chitinophaga sp. Cy-1792]|uniref:hypothetical protein n=1 Tax=Chitinophaga sp. Cy-1792 TaxID=2608339 RepID=UPI00141EEE9D|nr:hypothetical protein [Chitinophaga sp. Cy-1792]NIG52877.1 hypothetical protein [Chitinophaga sp. Cy-1792]
MERNYNHVYAKIIEGNDIIVGPIAYSMYKKSKIEYIEKQRESGNVLTDIDLVPFNNFSSSDSALDSYRIQAESIVQEFIKYILTEEVKNQRTLAIQNQAEILKNVIKPFTTSFGTNVLAGVIASFLFTLILAILLFIKTFGDLNISLKFEQKNALENTQPHK